MLHVFTGFTLVPTPTASSEGMLREADGINQISDAHNSNQLFK